MLLNTLLLSLIVFVRYLCFAGGLYFLCYIWKKKSWEHKQIAPTPPEAKVIKHEIKYSILSSILFGFMGAWMWDLWEKGKTLVYLDFSKYGFFYALLSLFAMLVIHDTYFYWTHRLLHLPWFYKRWHKVHHSAPNPSPWAAFCFHPIEALLESLYMPLIVFTVPSHPAVLGVFLMIMTVLGVVNHLGYELYPAIFHRNKFLNTIISATNHSVHHRFNKFNYALYFTWWDDLMSTRYSSNQAISRKTVGVSTDSELHHLGGFAPVPEDSNALQS